MSFEIVKIIDFVETLIFALRATLKKGLEENASRHVIFFCAAALGRAPICNSIRVAYWGFPLYGEPLTTKVKKKMIVIHSIGFSSFGDSFLHEKMRWKTLYAPEKFPRAPEKRILKGIAESLEILKTNSLHLVPNNA